MPNRTLSLREYISWRNDARRIIHDCVISYLNFTRLYEPRTEVERWHLSHGFFQHLRAQYFFTLTTQLAKLFDDHRHQKRNFIQLLTRLKIESYDQDLLHALDQNKTHPCPDRRICQHRDELVIEADKLLALITAFAKRIQNVVDYRNRATAHTDPRLHHSDLTTKDIGDLVALAEFVFNEVELKIMDQQFDFRRMEGWKVDPILAAWVANNDDPPRTSGSAV